MEAGPLKRSVWRNVECIWLAEEPLNLQDTEIVPG